MSKLTLFLFILLAVVLYTQITIFVAPPIRAASEGQTLVLWRYSIQPNGEIAKFRLKPIDSTDALCARRNGHVTLVCRGTTMALLDNNSTILFSLPYSRFLQSLAE